MNRHLRFRRHAAHKTFGWRSGVILGLLSLAAGNAAAQTAFTFTGTKSDLWNDPTNVDGSLVQLNWVPSTVPPAPPNDPSADPTIPAGLTAEVNGIFTVGAMTIASGATLNLPTNTGLSIQPGAFDSSGSVVNNGVIQINPNAIFGNGHTTSDVTLSGAGSVVLAGGIIGPNNLGYNGRFINSTNAISGSGEIGSSFAGAAGISFTNHALVDANVPYNNTPANAFTIYIGSDGSLPYDSYNTGILRATNGGLLQLAGGTLDNTSGTITATGANSAVVLSLTKISSGSLSSSSGGIVRSGDNANPNLDSLSITGTYQVTNHSSTTLTGTIHNSGTILLNSLPSSSTSILAGNTTSGATLAGGGIVQMANSQNDNRINGILTNADNTIQGVGLIDCNSFTNQGTVNANSPFNSTLNNTLTIWNGFTNSGTIEATSGGKLVVGYPGVIYNTGGAFFAADNSLVQINGNGADVRGGTFSTAGTGLITGSNVRWTDLANTGHFQVVSGTLLTNGTINNTGTISLGNNGMLANTTTTLTGNGHITLAGAQLEFYTTGTTLTNNSNTLEGYGYIGNGFTDLFNHGTISANVLYNSTLNNLLIVEPGTASTNTGIMQATNGGALEIFRGTLTNTGGNVSAADQSTAILNGVKFTGGNVSSTGTGQILVQDSTTLDGVTLAGTVSQSGYVYLSHTITNNATFTTAANSTLSILPTNATLTGTGTLVMQRSNINGSGNGSAPYPTLTNYISISGSGTIGNASADVVNHGHITATDPTNTLALYPASTFTNAGDGTIEASGAAGIIFYNTLANFVTSGTVQSDAGSQVNVGIPMTLAGGQITGAGPVYTRNLSVTGIAGKTGTGSLHVTGTVSLTSSARMDLDAGRMIIDGPGYNFGALTTLLKNGYNNGAWNGLDGIGSTIAANDPNHVFAVAMVDNAVAHFATFGDQSVSTSALLLMLTTYGDTNLDDTITSDDYARIDRGYQKHLTGWVNGDFNYDGAITSADYLLIDHAYGIQTGQLSPSFLAQRQAEFGDAYVSQLIASVPEPASLSLLAAGVLLAQPLAGKSLARNRPR